MKEEAIITAILSIPFINWVLQPDDSYSTKFKGLNIRLRCGHSGGGRRLDVDGICFYSVEISVFIMRLDAFMKDTMKDNSQKKIDELFEILCDGGK